MSEKKRAGFSSSIGFIMAAAGSAVGLGNIWRFPYLAAKGGGGLFLLFYIILALTFGFTLLTSEIAIGRKTKQGPLTAYSKLDKRFGFLGILACAVPVIILPYYCAIGGWVLKYFLVFATGHGTEAAEDGFFTGFITQVNAPVIAMVIFLLVTAFIIIAGVEKGIEGFSKVLMPILFVLIIGIAIFSLTLKHEDASGTMRTGLQGLAIYLIPNISGMTLNEITTVLMSALGQLFYSISVAMGIMVAYGSYAKEDTNLIKSINQIEFFDTIVAILAGMMIVPAVFTFMGMDGMSAGPGLMFISLPKVFAAMGKIGGIVGLIFFAMVTFAAFTSSVSIYEAIEASIVDRFHLSRGKTALLIGVYTLVAGTIVCFGYNYLYFELPLPNGSVAQVLDLMDYVSNNILMPVVAILTCILIGWVIKPQAIIDEVEQDKYKFNRKTLYIVMVKYVAPVMLFVLFLQALGIIKF